MNRTMALSIALSVLPPDWELDMPCTEKYEQERGGNWLVLRGTFKEYNESHLAFSANRYRDAEPDHFRALVARQWDRLEYLTDEKDRTDASPDET